MSATPNPFRTLVSWLSKPAKSSKAPRRAPRTTLGLMAFEDRLVPAVTRADLIGAFNTGAAVVRTADSAVQVVKPFAADIPVLKETLAGAADLAAKFQAAFAAVNDVVGDGPAVAGVDAQFQRLVKEFQDAVPGATVERFSLTPDARNDVVRVRYVKTIAVPTQFSVGGEVGFTYFEDRVNGKLAGTLAAGSTTVKLDLTYGIDLVGGLPKFYVADTSKLTVDPLTVTGTAAGDLAIRSLAKVNVTGAVVATFAGQAGLVDNKDGTADGRVRPSALAASATGTVTSTLALNNVKFKATVPVIGSIDWGGQFASHLTNGSFAVDTAQLTAPDAVAVIKNAAKGVLTSFAGGNVPLLGDGAFKSLLSGKLPSLGDISILNKLGLGGGVPTFSNTSSQLGTTLDSIKAALPAGFELLPGRSLTLADAKAVVGELIDGKRVDLVRYTNSGSKEWKATESFTVAAFPVAGPVTAAFGGSVSASVGAKYFVGVGMDTTGLYIDPRTSFSLFGGVDATADATVALFGLLGARVSVGLGAQLEAGVKLNDPDPTDGKIYLDEVFNPAKGVLNSLLDSLKFYAQANVNGVLRVKAVLPWPLPDITVFEKVFKGDALWSTAGDKKTTTPDGKTTFRALPLAPDTPLNVDALVRVENGQRVLVLDGTAEANGANIQLAKKDGKVKVTWFGRGGGTATTAIDRVRFVGSAKADLLEASDEFDLPIDARGNDGDDQLTGGAAADVLDGGAGADELTGQGGGDVLTGGAGRNALRGGAGNDTLTAGDEGDALAGDEGDDVLTGGAGADVLAGGVGNDRLDGGAGNNKVLGGDGNDTVRGGAGADVLDGGAGNDSLDAGLGNDILAGGDGRDALLAGAGDDRLDGGAGNDRLEGGAGNDVLRGGGGNDTMIGGAGNDLLSGGLGRDVMFGDDVAGLGAESGQDGFEIDFATPDAAVDEMRGGPDRDYVSVSGQVSTVTKAEVADDIKLRPGATAGSYVAGWRPAGSTAAYQETTFAVPVDVDAVWVRAGGGNDRVEIDPAVLTSIYVDGGAGNDTIFGGGGADILYGAAGHDTVDGRGGNDLVFGDGDVDTPAVQVPVAPAAEGNDVLTGGDGIDVVYGGGGADRVLGGAGSDFLHGGAGADVLWAGDDVFGDSMFGDAGADYLVGGPGRDDMHGGDDNDTLLGGDGSDLMAGDAGDDRMAGELGRDTLSGGAGNDSLEAWINNPLRATVASRAKLTLPALTPPTEAQDAARKSALEAERTALRQREEELLNMPEEQRMPEIQQVQNRLNDIESALQDLRRYNSNVVDSLNGDEDNDTLTGTPFNDRIDAGAGDDTINQSSLGRFGDDVIVGGTGTDAFAIAGTNAADTITMTTEADGRVGVYGTGGVLLGRFGTAGSTTGAFLEVETLRVLAGLGNDTVSLAGLGQKVPVAGQIEAFGGDGNDRLDAGTYEGATLLDGGAGNDTLTGGLIADLITGGAGNDTLVGGFGNDTLAGGDGADSLTGEFGSDALYGGAGDDTISGGSDDDTLVGGDGNDRLDGGYGDDTLHGDDPPGTLYLIGQPEATGADSLDGGYGNDAVYGGNGDDQMNGGGGNDYMDGGAGNDYLQGDGNIYDAGIDYLIGGTGSDVLDGQRGDDTLNGNTADWAPDGFADRLIGGAGGEFDVAQVNFREPEILDGIEYVFVPRQYGELVLVRNDQTIMAVSGGDLWQNGGRWIGVVQDAKMSPSGNDLYVLTTWGALIRYSRDGTEVVVQTRVSYFYFDGFGRLRYERY